MHLVKIVRDKVGDQAGREVSYDGASGSQVVEGLRKKLVEEALEYLLNPSVKELADVLEVAYALSRWDLQIEPWEVDAARDSKRTERGGFNDGIGMFVS